MSSNVVLLPDAGPLITLAYADALDVLFKPRWSVKLVDMVLHEVTRNQTPTSNTLAKWAKSKKLPIVRTKTFQHYRQTQGSTAPRKSNFGKLAIQEAMNLETSVQPRGTRGTRGETRGYGEKFCNQMGECIDLANVLNFPVYPRVPRGQLLFSG